MTKAKKWKTGARVKLDGSLYRVKGVMCPEEFEQRVRKMSELYYMVYLSWGANIMKGGSTAKAQGGWTHEAGVKALRGVMAVKDESKPHQDPWRENFDFLAPATSMRENFLAKS